MLLLFSILIIYFYIKYCTLLKNKPITRNLNNVTNPFIFENKQIIKKLNNEINSILTNNYDWSYKKWILLYIKYYYKISKEYLNFIIFDVFYDEETYIFEKDLLNLMKNYNKILDFGCGTCKIWRNNKDYTINKKIHCIDLDINTLSYSKYLLKDMSNITINNNNLFDLNMNYDVILFSEVIMQLDEPEKFISYIINKNPKIKIIACHTIFSPFVSKIITPFKYHIMKHLPLLNTSSGRALTYDQTINIFTSSNCKLEKTIKIYNNKIIFVFGKS